MGRWINRDPLGEDGGLNLYGAFANSPTNYADPYGLTPSEWLYTGEWNPSQESYDAALDSVAHDLPMRAPDYYSVNGGAGLAIKGTTGFAGQVVVDRYGNVYAGGGAGAGRSNKVLSGSVTVGWLDQGGYAPPTRAETEDFITGHGENWTAGYGAVAGRTHTTVGPTNTTWRYADEVGIGTPQAGGSVTYTKKLWGPKPPPTRVPKTPKRKRPGKKNGPC